jgi:hypothetical protein
MSIMPAWASGLAIGDATGLAQSGSLTGVDVLSWATV